MTNGINRVNMDFEACINLGCQKKTGIDRNGMTIEKETNGKLLLLFAP